MGCNTSRQDTVRMPVSKSNYRNSNYQRRNDHPGSHNGSNQKNHRIHPQQQNNLHHHKKQVLHQQHVVIESASMHQPRGQPRQHERQQQKRQPSILVESNKKNRECDVCGHEGHSSARCYHRNNTCHICQQQGHIASVCKQKTHHPNSIYKPKSTAKNTNY